MIDYKSSSGSDNFIERVPSANLEGPISLTWLWEIIVRTKRLPDDLDPKVLFIVLRDRLRNPEREVRQHALRVLADLVPIIEQINLDKHMELLLPDLIINLSHVAPAVRKGTVDVLRLYVKHSLHPNDVLKKLMTAVPEDSHLMQGLLMAVPYFTNYPINEETLIFLLRQLLLGIEQDFLRETALCSLIRTRSKLGIDRFGNLLGPEKVQQFQEICKIQNIHLQSKESIEEDNVILETEITLETGPAITMKIHEESSTSNFSDYNGETRHESQMTDSESEAVTRSPRKVHFGGEIVKMRTPESDSNHQSSDDNDTQTSVIIDRPTSIKITLSDNVAAIKTRHKSMIPVRITTGGSNPSTPKKRIKPKRLHKSAPELGRVQTSKIPLPQNGKSSSKTKDSKNKEQSEQKTPRVRRHSRGEDEFSPVPVHNEIEVFHNLTRSPQRTKNGEETTSGNVEENKTDDKKGEKEEGKKDDKKNGSGSSEIVPKNTYASFQVCKDDVKEENVQGNNNPSPMDIIVHDLLIHKEDTWSKSRALDDLVVLLRKKSFDCDSIPTSQLLQALFLCEKQPRLRSRAQEALKLIISTINLQTLEELFPQLCNDVIKIRPPSGVRLSLMVMQRSSPRQFFDNLNVEPSSREAMLQAMIAAARTFPSSEIDLIKGIHLAFDAMKDNKRAVRQAALETLATLAQVAGNAMILEAVNMMLKNTDDPDNLLTVVRTRLSRRQLPTLDLDGNIRYSSPRAQEEFEWLCGGTPSLSKTTSLNSIKVPTTNYWKHNLRHDLDSAKNPPTFNESSNDEFNNGNKEQLWTIDSTVFPKIENGTTEKAILCPVYVLHNETPQANGRNYRNFDRGRSNSPPNRRRNFESQETFDDVNANKSRRFYRQNEQFRKSFSSEHIYNENHKQYEPTSVSLSSRSSTTSTGSSTKSGLWLREFKSSIPVPISSDSKLKFRSNRHTADSFSGPLIAQDSAINRTKLESPIHTPVIRKPSPQQVFTQQLPPPSSGSESSGYFTPPAEHHLKDPPFEKFVSDETFEENNNLSEPEPNFQVVDSEGSETQEFDVLRQSSASSAETTGRIEEVRSEENNQVEDLQQPKSFSPLDEVDFDDTSRTFAEPRSKSRSEASLKTSLPEITERKNVNSAPPLNDVVNLVPYEFTETPVNSPIKISLPGSVTSSDNTPTKKVDQTPRRLMRRSISVRTPSVKRRTKSPKAEVRPISRPKEILNQGLAQMESCDWETTMQGLNSLIRLARNHPEVLELQMHTVCVALAKNIKNLRSQVARTACRAASEIFSSCKKGLDMELEELAVPLLQRTADTNKFLRSDANAALDAMSLNLSVPRVVAVITNKGSTHQNCVVRAAATRLLSDIAMRIGPDKVFQLPKETRDKFLFVGANGLTEGSLETRRHAKALMSTLVTHQQFQKALLEAVPQHTLRHIAKVINSLK